MSRPSTTATIIALATVCSGRSGRDLELIPPGAFELSQRCLAEAAPAWLVGLARDPRACRGLLALERCILPGLVRQYLLRKRWIEAAVRKAHRAGLTQLVVIGAGYDTLATRLGRELPGLRCIELDRPDTQGPKRRAVRALAPGHPLHLVPADLARVSLGEVLAACPAYDPRQPACFVAEGVLMYLEAAAVAAFFRSLREQASPGSQLVFSFLESPRHGALGYRQAGFLTRALLRWRGEVLRWGLAPEALGRYVQTYGLELRELAGPAELLAEGPPLGAAPLATGELMAVAQLLSPGSARTRRKPTFSARAPGGIHERCATRAKLAGHS